MNFSGAAYVFVRDGTTWTRQAYLKPSNTGLDDTFGSSVAISDDTVVIGAPFEASSATGVNGNQTADSAPLSGAAYVFARTGTTWSQRSYLKASNTDLDDRFGASVAVSGDTIVVGAPQEGSNATGVDGNGANNDAARSGAAYIFGGSTANAIPTFPEYFIDAFAGTGLPGFSGDGSAATNARLDRILGIAADASGNVYLADSANHRIRIVRNGIISTFAGDGEPGFNGDGGPAAQARLNYPSGLAVGRDGKVYFSDSLNHRVRVIDANGVITTFAGTGSAGSSGDGGPATMAELTDPGELAVDSDGVVYIHDFQNSEVRRVDANGIIDFVAGSEADSSPTGGLAVDRSGRVYIAESENDRVRRVDHGGAISTFAGVGMRSYSGDGGAATQARLALPSGLAVSPLNDVLIADSGNFRIRSVDAGGIIATVAGTGRRGSSGDGGHALAADLPEVDGLAIDAAGNVFLAGGYQVRQLSPTGRTIPMTPNYLSTPTPEDGLNFGQNRFVYLRIKNSPNSPVDLQIDAADLQLIAHRLAPSIPAELYPDRTTRRNDKGNGIIFIYNQLQILRLGRGNFDGNDPFLPLATYPIRYSERNLFARSPEFAFLEMLSTQTGAGQSAPESQLDRQSLAPGAPQTTTLTLDPSGVQRLIAEIPSFLGDTAISDHADSLFRLCMASSNACEPSSDFNTDG